MPAVAAAAAAVAIASASEVTAAIAGAVASLVTAGLRFGCGRAGSAPKISWTCAALSPQDCTSANACTVVALLTTEPSWRISNNIAHARCCAGYKQQHQCKIVAQTHNACESFTNVSQNNSVGPELISLIKQKTCTGTVTHVVAAKR